MADVVVNSIEKAQQLNNASLYQLLKSMRLHANKTATSQEMIQVFEDAVEDGVMVKNLFSPPSDFRPVEYMPVSAFGSGGAQDESRDDRMAVDEEAEVEDGEEKEDHTGGDERNGGDKRASDENEKADASILIADASIPASDKKGDHTERGAHASEDHAEGGEGNDKDQGEVGSDDDEEKDARIPGSEESSSDEIEEIGAGSGKEESSDGERIKEAEFIDGPEVKMKVADVMDGEHSGPGSILNHVGQFHPYLPRDTVVVENPSNNDCLYHAFARVFSE